MQPPATVPTLPFVVGAHRAAAVRRRRIAYPVVLVAAVVGGSALGYGWTEVLSDGTTLGWLALGLAALAVVVVLVGLRHTRRPPEDDWLFALEPAGLRFPPGRRAATTMPGHPGVVVPWPLITTLSPSRLNGEPTIHVGLRPEVEGVLLEQGFPPPRARLAARKPLRLRLGAGALPPEECLRLIAATRASRFPG